MESDDPFVVRGWRRVLLTVLAAATAAGFALPTLWTIVSSVRPQTEIFRYATPLQLHTFVPTTLTAENFTMLLGSPFARAVVNSFVVATATVVLGLFIASLAAFALAAIEIPGRGVVFAVVVVSFLVPFDAIAVPMSTTFRGWGLADTYAGLVLPGLGNGLAIFLLRQFFLAVPTELRDAARVDGASWWAIYWRLYVPLAKPAMIGAGLLLFLFAWQSYLWPLLITTDRSLDVAPVALARLFGQFATEYGQLFAGAVVIASVPAVLLLIFQRQFSASVSTAGLKE